MIRIFKSWRRFFLRRPPKGYVPLTRSEPQAEREARHKQTIELTGEKCPKCGASFEFYPARIRYSESWERDGESRGECLVIHCWQCNFRQFKPVKT